MFLTLRDGARDPPLDHRLALNHEQDTEGTRASFEVRYTRAVASA